MLLTFSALFVLMYGMPNAKKTSFSSVFREPLQLLGIRLMYVVLLVSFLVIGYLLGKLESTSSSSTVTQGENQIAGQTGDNQAPPQAPSAPDPEEILKTLNTGNLPVNGKESAPVTIIEFSDFECPFCGRFYTDTLPQIEKEYIETGKVKMYYRHLPLAFHPQARPAALASECANDQGAFWKYHDKIFDSQAGLSTATTETYVTWAQEMGLNSASFKSCLEEEKFAENVDGDNSAAQAAGASGTPTFYINGKQLVGAQPFASFKAIIDAELDN